MKNRHIEDIIDSKSFTDLGESELRLIEAHRISCERCAAAFDAARVAATLMKASPTSSDAGPPPHFNRAVMTEWRRRSSVKSSVEFFGRWWAAYNPMVAVMVAVVLFLGGLAALAPSRDADPGIVNHSNLYPAEAVLIDQRPSRELNREQVFQVIYTTRYERKR